MPDYVAYELIYKNSKNSPEDVRNIWVKYYGNLNWTLVNTFNVNSDVWDSETIYSIKDMMQQYDNEDVKEYFPKNYARFVKQKEHLQQRGISQEPIIVEESKDEPGKYTLLEGWHRTVETMKVYPKGYTVPAYVGTPSTKSEQIRQTKPDSFWTRIKKVFKK